MLPFSEISPVFLLEIVVSVLGRFDHVVLGSVAKPLNYIVYPRRSVCTSGDFLHSARVILVFDLRLWHRVGVRVCPWVGPEYDLLASFLGHPGYSVEQYSIQATVLFNHVVFGSDANNQVTSCALRQELEYPSKTMRSAADSIR